MAGFKKRGTGLKFGGFIEWNFKLLFLTENLARNFNGGAVCLAGACAWLRIWCGFKIWVLVCGSFNKIKILKFNFWLRARRVGLNWNFKICWIVAKNLAWNFNGVAVWLARVWARGWEFARVIGLARWIEILKFYCWLSIQKINFNNKFLKISI